MRVLSGWWQYEQMVTFERREVNELVRLGGVVFLTGEKKVVSSLLFIFLFIDRWPVSEESSNRPDDAAGSARDWRRIDDNGSSGGRIFNGFGEYDWHRIAKFDTAERGLGITGGSFGGTAAGCPVATGTRRCGGAEFSSFADLFDVASFARKWCHCQCIGFVESGDRRSCQ